VTADDLADSENSGFGREAVIDIQFFRLGNHCHLGTKHHSLETTQLSPYFGEFYPAWYCLERGFSGIWLNDNRLTSMEMGI
jgi:hypothetical protein